MAVPYDEHTALLVVDVQNDFADPDGSLFVSGADDVVDVVNREVAAAAGRGGAGASPPRTGTRPSRRTSPRTGARGPSTAWPTRGAPALHTDLARPVSTRCSRATGGEDGYSGFSMVHPTSGETTPTGLDDLLRERGIERVVVVGLATDYCVKETALDAVRLGFDTTVLLDGMRCRRARAGRRPAGDRRDGRRGAALA